MKPQRKRRLTTVFLILISSAFGSCLIIKALDTNLVLFFTPSELYSQNIPDNKRIKVGGMVLEGSVKRDKTNIIFEITDYKNSITVNFNGIVPDLFQEGSGVVVLGYMNKDVILAEEVLAKHDENYMPPNLEIEK